MIKTPFRPGNLASSGAVMKRTALALTIIWILLFTLVTETESISLASAQTFTNIVIKSDGSIEPETDLLERRSNIYTLKSDIFGTIMVQKDSITIDGAGYTLYGRSNFDERGLYLVGPDRSHPSCRNVLVKNLRIYNFYTGVFSVGGSNNSIIGNFLENAGIEFIGNANYLGNIIKHNTFRNATIYLNYYNSGLGIITENNFSNLEMMIWLSVAPNVIKNYWSDYKIKYPDAKELGSSGIWDTPYFISKVESVGSLIDQEPLVYPVTDFEIPHFSNPNGTLSPTSSPTLEPSISPTPDTVPYQPEPFPTVPIAAFIASVIVVAVGLVICFKKRKGEAER